MIGLPGKSQEDDDLRQWTINHTCINYKLSLQLTVRKQLPCWFYAPYLGKPFARISSIKSDRRQLLTVVACPILQIYRQNVDAISKLTFRYATGVQHCVNRSNAQFPQSTQGHWQIRGLRG